MHDIGRFNAQESFDFNKTIDEIVQLTENEIEMTHALDTLLAALNIRPSPLFFLPDPLNAAIATAQLALSQAQFIYQIIQDSKKAEQEEIDRARETEQFQHLARQNDIQIQKLDEIKDSIDASAIKISNAIVRDTFDEKVKLPMGIFYASLNRMRTDLFAKNESLIEFKKLCSKSSPLHYVDQMLELTNKMFHTQLGEAGINGIEFFLVANLHIEVMTHFFAVYPFCSTFLYQTDAETINNTIKNEAERLGDALFKAGIDQDKKAFTAESLAKLFQRFPKVDSSSAYVALDEAFGPVENYIKKEKDYVVALTIPTVLATAYVPKIPTEDVFVKPSYHVFRMDKVNMVDFTAIRSDLGQFCANLDPKAVCDYVLQRYPLISFVISTIQDCSNGCTSEITGFYGIAYRCPDPTRMIFVHGG